MLIVDKKEGKVWISPYNQWHSTEKGIVLEEVAVALGKVIIIANLLWALFSSAE